MIGNRKINKGYYFDSDKTSKGDECFTPYYAVEPLLKYLKKNKVIWCPFDEKFSAYVNMFRENGYKVIRSHLNDGKDFFKVEPPMHYDIIISNPPFSEKDKVIKRLYELNKPFAILLPLNAIQGKARFKYFKKGLQILAFDKRIKFHIDDMKNHSIGNTFASGYFCRNFLPNDFILEELKEYSRELK